MGAYFVLAGIASLVLSGKVLLVILILFAGLAFKTFIATRRDL